MGTNFFQFLRDNSEIVTLVGIATSFFVSGWALIASIKNSKKTIYINSVTSSRIKYIQDLRNSIAEYCGLVHSYHANRLVTGGTEALEIQKRFDTLKYLVELNLNVVDDFFDPAILEMLKSIHALKDNSSIEEVEKKIEPLISIVQYLLKFEWEGAKQESKSGMLSKRAKRKLYDKHIELYRNRLNIKPKLTYITGTGYLSKIRLIIKNESRQFVEIKGVQIGENEPISFDLNEELPYTLRAGDKRELELNQKKGPIFAWQTSTFELKYSFDLIFYDNLGRKYKVTGDFIGAKGKLSDPIQINA
jgi:hypothetical protein